MTTVFVTHDFGEVAALCDRCAVLNAGAILQDAPPTQVLDRPRTRRVAEIVGLEDVGDSQLCGLTRVADGLRVLGTNGLWAGCDNRGTAAH
jgi:ABC-type sulfate/molybdate transport systems ATPase subunit